MSKQDASLINYNSPGLIDKIRDQPIFVLCDTCYWCATYMDKTRMPVDNTCPQCGSKNSELTSFPIISNEVFTFDYNEKRGVELEFRPRPKRS